MKDLENNMYRRLQYEQSYNDQEESPCNGTENVSIIVHKKKVKNRKKNLTSKYGQHPAVAFRLSRSGTLKNRKLLKNHSSMPEINNRPKLLKQRTKSSTVISWGRKHNLNTKFIVNRVSEYHFNNYISPFNYPTQKKWKVYRCQLSTKEESCCCSCNSDAMFEVMKSLYDCYKKKNCDDCNCILCGHLPREERRLGRIRKSLADVGLAGSAKEIKEKRKKAEKQMEGKSAAEKEKILKELAKTGQPLPKGKTASEKELIRKVRTELGLPPEPKTAAEKAKMRKAEAAGLITPLEGKTTAQKEKILKAQADLGLELPEGRTASEKALIHKIKTAAGIPTGITSEKLRKAKEAGLLTPLEGKSAEKREKILRGLAMQGLPLPEGKTASERKIIDKVRADLGLPPEPKTPSMKEKYAKAANAGLMQPLEGKSAKEKEKILQGLADLGIPLPEGRTPSERALIAKVTAKAAASLEYVAPSEKIRRAKAAGLTTPIAGKPPEQQEKILKGLAMQGILLPEGKTASEKRLIDKVRVDLGLPPEPKTTAMKARYAKAADAGLLQPLEGKTYKEKEKILQGLHDLGIPLPEGRTASEKSLIARVKGTAPEPVAAAPSEKIKKAKAAGFLTPLEGKTAEQREKILTGLAMQGIPLPEGKTASEKKIIDKVRKQLGLPPEPKNKAMRDKYNRAADAGLLQPLEGKSAKEKEKILQGLYDMGIPLPQGRTKSEKALVAKIKAGPKPPELLAPSEKLRKAKAAGFLTPLEGKPPEQKEKILRGLAMQGILLPEGKTASERKIMDKVRVDLGLPPEPKTQSMKERYARAADAGILLPLEGKTTKEKEKILQGLYDMGIPLPEGRTASEKSLIARIREKAKAPSVKMRKAKAEGLLTPLEGKSPEQKEKILRGLAMQGIPLPEGKTASEKMLIDKVRNDLGLPPEPKNRSMREKYSKAADAGLMQPLEGKSAREKEKILRGLHEMGIPLPEGRTKSEKAIIAKIKAKPAAPLVASPSEKMRKAKAAGLLTPLEGKTAEQREKILRGIAMQGIPLPEGKTASEKRIIDKVRVDLGLPPEPKNQSMRGKYARAADAGFLQPLEGKSHKEKEKILQGLHNMGIPLPVGRTASEKALIAKIQAESRPPSVLPPSEKLRKAKAAGLLTPLKGKSPAQREKILRGLAMQGVPLPEAKTASEKMLIDKVRTDLGLPPEPTTASMRDRYNRAADAGLLQPLEGKSHKEKERILQGLHDLGIQLPEGRTASEKALVAKIRTAAEAPSVIAPSEKMRRAKAAGLLTPLEGKTPAQKEKILRGLAMQGLPLPEGKTASERKLVNKVRTDLGLPPEPKTPSMKEKYEKAANAGLLQPLEGKTTKEKERILQGLHDMGIPLPEGRTASEKALIAKVKAEPRLPTVLVPSEKLRKAQAAGLLTPLEGKSPAQREKILRGLAMQGIPLPEGKTASEKMIVSKVRADLGLPPTPKTAAEREKYNKAVAAGLITPLEGKSAAEKENILREQHKLGLPLPKGRTSSERAIIKKIKQEKVGKRTIGVGSPALPPEKRRKLDEKTAKVVKEGTGPADECICGLLTPESERETPPPLEIPSEKLRAARAAGLLTPLQGKSPEQKEKIIRGLAKQGIPLPEGRTASERKLIEKVRAELGLPPEPRVREPSITTEKIKKAKEAGLLTPLEGKSAEQKEKILRGLATAGLPLPEGRTASEKLLIKKIKTELGVPERTPSEKVRKAKLDGLLTPLEGKTALQKEKILRGRAAAGLPLPPGKTASERALVQRIKKETGYITPSPSERMRRAKAAGLLIPLEGKTTAEKEKILRDRLALGIPIPEGKTPSEKEIIKRITAEAPPVVTASERLKKAKAAGVLTPLEGKSKKQKEKIIRGLIKAGAPLPEPKTASEKNLMDKVRREVGLPPEPKTPSLKEKYRKAHEAGIITPLEGKSTAEKEKVLRRLHEAGIPLPEGRTKSEKNLIKRIKAELPERKIPSEKVRAARAAGLLTPLEGKTAAQKEKIIRGLAEAGIPLPEAKTASEKALIQKVRTEMGLPPEPATASVKEKMRVAQAQGIITPLEGKTAEQKEQILKNLAEAGIPLPEGRTASEKALIAKVKAESKVRPAKITSEKLKKAKAAGLLTPLAGKSAQDKEKIMRGLVEQGLPLPETHTASERKIADKIRAELGLPPEPKTSSERLKLRKAEAAGIVTPLEGKTRSQKERILRDMADAGVTLPEGRTKSEKEMIKRIKAGPVVLPPKERRKLDVKTAKVMKEGKGPSDECICGLLTPESEREEPTMAPTKVPSEKLKKAKAAGLLTPLEGKSSADKERILRGLAKEGIPLPEAKTSSERKITEKIRKELGLPPEPKTQSMKEKHEQAAAAGVLVPLEGLSSAEKERVLRAQADLGIQLPEGRTASEKALIAKIKTEKKLPPSRIASEKLRKAKAAGFLTPLEGKKTAEKEKILRGLAKEGIPLPEAKTSSERKIIAKIRKEYGLPPEPKTRSMRERHERAAAAGVLVPLQGLPPAEKERVLRAQADLGIELPEGRTKSEKALIAKIKAEPKLIPAKTVSDKMRKAKEAGLLTPLEGKSAAEKERILRGLVQAGVPLPEAKTTSERKLAYKIRKELGLPPEPKTAAMKERHEKAAAAGVLVPLEGLSPAEKERVLRAQADMGIELPEGRTASERALIAKVKAESKLPPSKVASERLRKAKTAGLLTPLLGKSAAEKERILRGLANQGLPLPIAHTSSERKIAEKIRKELGLPPEPKTATMEEQHNKAAAAGFLVPLEGLSPAEKERVLRGQADFGIPLPEGRTASEKALIAKIKAEGKLPPSRVASERMRKAKAAGLLTPLKGKKAKEKEKIMRGLAKEGLPLPEVKTSSERKLADKIRKELGLPPEPKTPSMREKHEKAAAAGILVPLEGLTPAEKERVLRAQAEMGIPLPEGRTSSEKSLIAKIKGELEPSLIPSKKLKKAKAAGLLTPLEGKTHAQKEKIIRKLAEAGLPLPEGKTASEKALIHKVRTELGIPPPARTVSEKAVVRKAKADGLLTPIHGKSAKEKERILKGLAEAGLPMPEGKTASEKELIKKIRTAAGLAPEATPSEKRGEIKTKSKRVGVTTSRKVAKGIGAGGIAEEYEDIMKTTTCDRGCGCDKKKIRFKHSYVKIRVTSPDISSLCPCPDECLPGVKSGAFIDNEGIKVTVGRVDGVTSYTSQYSNDILESSKHIITLFDKLLLNNYSSNSSIDTVDESLNSNIMPNNLQQTTDDAPPCQGCIDNKSKMNHGERYSSTSYSSDSYDSHASYMPYKKESNGSGERNDDRWIDGSGRFLDSTEYLETLGEIYRRPVMLSYTSDDTVTDNSSRDSLDSIIVIKSESSLSLSTTSSVDVISVISFSNSSSGSDSTHYLYCPVSGGNFSDSTVEELECLTNRVDYSAADTVTSQSNNLVTKVRRDETRTNININTKETPSAVRRRHNEFLTFRMSQMKFSHEIHKTKNSKKTTGEPVIVINNLNSEHDIKTMVDQLLSKNEFSNASSIFVVVPTSDDNDSDHSIDSAHSTICIQVSEHHKWNRIKSDVEGKQITTQNKISSTRGVKISSHGRKYFMEGMHNTATSVHKKETLEQSPKGFECVYTKQRSRLNDIVPGELLANRYNVASTDTTADRPCCCAPKLRKDAVQNLNSNHRCVANVVSELITPLLVNQGLGYNPYQRMTTLSVNKQASFVSMSRPPTPVGACQMPPCAGRGCHHPSDMYQIPFGTPMPPPQPEKPQKPEKLENKSKPCQCNPEKMQEMLEKAAKAAKPTNVKSTGCGGAPPIPSPVILAAPPVPKPIDPDEDCKACSQPKYKEQCACDGKKRTKLKSVCPCERHQPPVSKTATGPKANTRSLGCQCCMCVDSPGEHCTKKFFGIISRKSAAKPSKAGYLEVLGPAGGLAQIEKEGTFTQAGRRDLPTTTDTTAESSTSTKKDCACKEKRKKKQNIICECPPPLEPEPDLLAMTTLSPLDFSYEELIKYQLLEQKFAMKQKSDMTQTLSGFRIFKKKKPAPTPEPEFTVEDAVRYYATIHPDVLKDLCPPPPDFRETKDCACEDAKPKKKSKKEKEADCICPYEPPPPPPPPPPPDDEGPFRGLKITMGGKGSGSKGLSGVCCFDVVEELNMSKQRFTER